MAAAVQEHNNWAIVASMVGRHRYDTPAELLPLGKIWVLRPQPTN